MQISIALLNVFYATFGALTTLIFMILGYWIFDKLTPFRTGEQLRDNNLAVGIVVGSIFVGLGIAIGLVIGLGLN
ncbi:DUF350 domain-containing protein [bacterium]|nr:DUF350 domain-containing protein [bacterium]